jgi:hypothetical protein
MPLPHPSTSQHASLKLAALYFAITFAVGFVLGPLRIFVLTPRVGPVIAVLIEAPFMLSAAYFIARWVLRRFAPAAPTYQRLSFGIIAFGMLLTAECLLALTMGIRPVAFLHSLATPAGAIGLASQIVFAFIPALIRPATPVGRPHHHTAT